MDIQNFETAYLNAGGKSSELEKEDGEYVSSKAQMGWQMWQAATAQSVPEVINVGNELQSWVAVWSFKARHDHEDYIVVDANLLADKIEKLTGANA